MKIMVIGGGGREHAIIKAIKKNKSVEEIYALPGNGGMAKDATLVNIGAKDIDKIVEFAKENKIDYGGNKKEHYIYYSILGKLVKVRFNRLTGLGSPLYHRYY